jgi:hypothetical protein
MPSVHNSSKKLILPFFSESERQIKQVKQHDHNGCEIKQIGRIFWKTEWIHGINFLIDKHIITANQMIESHDDKC